ncbi:hypothetical protein A4H97_18095 [Niastella yeongjuensis]|uniref:DUF1254 domain-containing protein n=1 Tax=Niastella yeongjuensis TaxID=354355 RepID=A0A1V9DY86_9BACT|nr:DUF1254 domain-containing protein [Niastella yeongjuensis]OQP38635.1 hypothetical protein A4H97_18095 [Niastella yeongjuensis]SEO38657.1 Uncharacterized conserved protein [Niastella yeongjuensis]
MGKVASTTKTKKDTTFKPASIQEHLLFNRAVEAVIWGMPAVNFGLLCQATIQAKSAANEIVYWSRLPGWKNQTLTPNPDTIYFFPFFDTKKAGPVVIEIPPANGGSITGSIDDGWQTALEDVGPAGYDEGKGGKYLLLPPDFNDKVPDGYIVLPCSTYRGFAVLRSNLSGGSDAEVANAVEYGRQIRIYPLSAVDSRIQVKFTDVIDTLYDNTIPYDIRFFQMLSLFVQYEPWLDRDKAMIDILKTIGIEKGKAFIPDNRTQEILNAAIAEAHIWLDMQYELVFNNRYNAEYHWALPTTQELVQGMSTSFARADSYPLDARGMTYSMAYFSAKHLGQGQFYLMAIKDKNDKALDGGSTYKLNIPASPPVKLYWSAVVYDRTTHAFLREMKWFSRSSNTPGLQKNTNDSIDIYFGPEAPAGKESNWIPTNRQNQFEVLFRFYGPEEALFNKTWKLPDIEKV